MAKRSPAGCAVTMNSGATSLDLNRTPKEVVRLLGQAAGTIFRKMARWAARCGLAVLSAPCLAVVARAAVTLHWQNNDFTGTVTGIAIERSDAGGPFVRIAVVPPTSTSYRDAAAKDGITHAYRIAALASTIQSSYSNVAAQGPKASKDLVCEKPKAAFPPPASAAKESHSKVPSDAAP